MLTAANRTRPRRLFTLSKHRNYCDGDGADQLSRHRQWMMSTPAEYYLRPMTTLAPDSIGVGGWRVHRNGNAAHQPPASLPPPPRNFNGLDNLLHNVRSVEEIVDDGTHIGPMVTSFGTICVFLEQRLRVDITLDQAVRVVNPLADCVAAIDSSGSISGLVHPSGRVYHNGSQVDLLMTTAHGKRRAKVSHRGVAFACDGSPVVYLLDDGGVRTTVESFADLDTDFTLDVFYGDASNSSGSGSGRRYGQEAVGECLEVVAAAEHCRRRDNTWTVNGIDVTQVTRTGDLYVSRDYGRRQIKTSPVRNNVAVATPFGNACASSPPEAHVFVRRGERRIHASDRCFNARNGTHSAGFDETGQFKLY